MTYPLMLNSFIPAGKFWKRKSPMVFPWENPMVSAWDFPEKIPSMKNHQPCSIIFYPRGYPANLYLNFRRFFRGVFFLMKPSFLKLTNPLIISIFTSEVCIDGFWWRCSQRKPLISTIFHSKVVQIPVKIFPTKPILFEQGLVNVPFRGVWTSPSHLRWRWLYPQ